VLCLASASPRRAELLRQIGVGFEVLPAAIDETPVSGEPVETYVQRMAREKALAVVARPRDFAPVLGADTAVVIDGDILGKPVDRAMALAMLQRLSGRSHRVMSAVCLVTPEDCALQLNISQVRFRELRADEIARYWDSGEPRDKAGAYAIQGRGAEFVANLEGSFSAVMGLPLFETAQLLRAAGFEW